MFILMMGVGMFILDTKYRNQIGRYRKDETQNTAHCKDSELSIIALAGRDGNMGMMGILSGTKDLGIKHRKAKLISEWGVSLQSFQSKKRLNAE